MQYKCFSGEYTAYSGSNGKPGVSGTIYYTDTNAGLTHRPLLRVENNRTIFGDGFKKLLIDNKNGDPNLPTLILDNNRTYFELNELELRNNVVLHIPGNESTVVVHNFTGDRTGQVSFTTFYATGFLLVFVYIYCVVALKICYFSIVTVPQLIK